MKPAALSYERPATVDEAVDLLHRHNGSARVLAGGQSLVALMNLRLANPEVVVDIQDLAGLGTITAAGGMLQVGAGVTQAQLEDHPLVATVPLLPLVLPWIAHREIRNAGTVVGSLAHGDPASELPLVAVTLGAELLVASVAGTRTVPASELYLGYLDTSIADDELITAARFPQRPEQTEPPEAGAKVIEAFREQAPRHGDYALAGAGIVLWVDGSSVVTRAAIGALGVCPVPASLEVASTLVGYSLGSLPVAAVVEAARAEIDPKSDVHAEAAYRRHLFGVLLRRALEDAAAADGPDGGGGSR